MIFMRNGKGEEGAFTLDFPSNMGVKSEQKIDLLLWRIEELSAQISKMQSKLSKLCDDSEASE